MRSRFVLTIKNKGTYEQVLKARFVAQGFCDSEKSTLVHTAAIARQASTRIVVSLARAFGWDIQSHDVTQAYVQVDGMHRAFYLKPPAELNLKGKFLFLVKPLYGLTDAGDLWYETLSQFIKSSLVMRELISDPGVLFSSHSSGELLGMILTYVDDLLRAGCSAFLKRSLVIDDRFKSRSRQINQFRHAGFHVRRKPDITTLSQRDYAERITRLPKLCHFEGFRSARAKLQWLVNTRPDIAGSVSLLAQVTPEQYEQEHSMHNTEINRIIRYVQRRPCAISYLPLHFPSTRIVVCADASYASNVDRSSQLGYVLSLVDKHEVSHLLAYCSKKSPRVVTSIFSGEAIALAPALSHAYTLQHDIDRMTGAQVPIHLRTDSLAVFDAISKNTVPTDHRLPIDIAQLKESWRRREIAHLGFIRSRWKIADTMTKRNSPKILRVLTYVRDQAPVEQWIARPA
jgi:Reverse transcriptase (RNA-dependent DNA polymerase)